MNDMRGSDIRLAMPVFDIAGFSNYLNAMRAAGAECAAFGRDDDPAGFDGLLLPGGGDVDPALYGAQRLDECGPVDRALDDLQWRALRRFAEAGKPVLGICRGHQVLNAFFGGTLIQHIPQAERHSREVSEPEKYHPTRAAKGGFVERLYGEHPVTNSSHHQAVDAPAPDIEVVQWSDDGVVEAIRHRDFPVWGVQWHPERMCLGFAREGVADGLILLKWFVERCRAGGAGLA